MPLHTGWRKTAENGGILIAVAGVLKQLNNRMAEDIVAYRGKGSLTPDHDELPTCAMCMEVLGTYGGPASLTCGHNGCLACLQQVQRHSALPLCPLCRTPFDADLTLCLNLELRDALDHAQAARSAVHFAAAESQWQVSQQKGLEGEGQKGRSRYQCDLPWPEETGPWIPVTSAKGGKEGSSAVVEDNRGHQSDYMGGQNTNTDLNVWNVLRGALAMVTGLGRPGPVGYGDRAPDWQPAGSYGDGSAVLDRYDLENSWRSSYGGGHSPSAPPLLHRGSVDDIRAVRALLDAEPPEWMPDSAASACMQCAASFRPVTCGRHHCRFCGGLFCRRCSLGKCLLPVKFRERAPQRVCDTCFERLEPIQRTLADRVSNAAQVATHDVTDMSCMRGWLNSPVGLSMEQEIYKATNTVRSYYKIGKLKPERSIPDTVLKGARGLAILTVMKAGMMVTYKLGTGLVVARRADGSWSAPSAVASVGLGWGAQVGGELTDFIIVLRTAKAVKAFGGRAHLSLGAGMSAAAGPVGRAAEADLRAGDGGAAACYTYSCSKGAFVGVSLEYNVVATRTDTNLNFYGDAYLTATDILLGPVPQPRAAAPLYAALQSLFGKVDSITSE
ncbi:unnamed protein product [Sphagnum balticum]